ncbi:GyrI-like domain-containing protein [Polaribacter gangjinensis]|uniref:GyrI-like domain-containing protein n=1 Tax=Polaribacter gangjinensis TaxID=574710 RepID=A0A2S7WA24_9FLAO|nr:GyrI-like domain-containing protein [Polaribacter gangjinensis]PQJ74475.1 GyrI-like domain-containing protein [Polaribacter gangjinensis]
MQPSIIFLEEKKLVGKKLQMSLVSNKTAVLWESFMPHLSAIQNKVSNDLFSLQVYDKNYFEEFNPQKEFLKWALIEVTDFDNVPPSLETFVIPSGQYAVFIHKGDTKEFYKTSQYIYGTWLPNSNFVLDDRPHFEILGEKTKNDDPNSEEEVWIPIKATKGIF